MKLSLYSLIIGASVHGLLACGSSSTKGSSQISTGAGATGGGGAPVSAGGTGTTIAPNGTAGATDLRVPTDNGGNSGTDQTCDGGVCGCPASNTTTIEGFVYDPAGKNPLYNVSVYVPDPASPLPDLDSVPLGCGCTQLYPAKVLAVGKPTDATGHFVIPCAPAGTVSLVVQTGKWRMQYPNVTVVANQANMAPKLRLPAKASEGSLPNIAISTGGSDSLECLPLRLGVDASEYALGSATGGHIHIYTGYHGATMTAGSVNSYQTLWDKQDDLNQHDVVLLSCEGEETFSGTQGMPLSAATQTLLMNYANAGGRVFASHFHYAWFNTGPFATGANQLATWNTGMQTLNDAAAIQADIDTTLASGAPFPEGSALQQWLMLVGALTNNQLPIWYARTNVKTLVTPTSTEWIHIPAGAMRATASPQYFSADTPVGGAVCGRVVYSDVHVSGGPGMSANGVAADYPTPRAGGTGGTGGTGGAGGGAGGTGGMGPGGFPIPVGPGGPAQGGIVPSECAMRALTPQEEALEFMFFDLSSCLVPIGQMPPVPTVPK